MIYHGHNLHRIAGIMATLEELAVDSWFYKVHVESLKDLRDSGIMFGYSWRRTVKQLEDHSFDSLEELKAYFEDGVDPAVLDLDLNMCPKSKGKCEDGLYTVRVTHTTRKDYEVFTSHGPGRAEELAKELAMEREGEEGDFDVRVIDVKK